MSKTVYADMQLTWDHIALALECWLNSGSALGISVASIRPEIEHIGSNPSYIQSIKHFNIEIEFEVQDDE